MRMIDGACNKIDKKGFQKLVGRNWRNKIKAASVISVHIYSS